jgi:hypothetical protein
MTGQDMQHARISLLDSSVYGALPIDNALALKPSSGWLVTCAWVTPCFHQGADEQALAARSATAVVDHTIWNFDEATATCCCACDDTVAGADSC